MNDKFEQQLANIKLVKASNNYQQKARSILRPRSKPLCFNWNYLWAMGLLLSLGFNWYQFTQPKVTIRPETMIAKNVPAQIPKHEYSVIQGAMVPYGGMRDLIIKLEN
jgi:hypothetical protein